MNVRLGKEVKKKRVEKPVRKVNNISR